MRHDPVRRMRSRISIMPLPVRPWDYVRMRREAAGVSIEDIAHLFYSDPAHRADVIRNIRAMEQPDFVLPYPGYDASDMRRAFAISPDVFRQLHEHSRFHPRLCLSCGWDEWTEQNDLQGFSATWSTEHHALCTRCEQTLDREGRN